MCLTRASHVSARSSTTTTMVIDSKNGDAGSQQMSKKTFTDNLYSTFSSPLAWILVIALIITWSCVFVIMLDLTDYKTISGEEETFVSVSSPREREVTATQSVC